VSTIPFTQLPLVVKIAVGVAFYNAWWLIEEFVIDRYGFWKFMPHYKVADQYRHASRFIPDGGEFRRAGRD
jgi:hypothetical protein